MKESRSICYWLLLPVSVTLIALMLVCFAKRKVSNWTGHLTNRQQISLQTDIGFDVDVSVEGKSILLLCRQNGKSISFLEIDEGQIRVNIETYPGMKPFLFYSKNMDSGTLHTIYDENLMPKLQTLYDSEIRPVYRVERKAEDIFPVPFSTNAPCDMD